ncbi:3-isopropylmalate dehydrogenase [Sphingomonas sp. SRS2]|uniref:3-isopropylmalate dehydrogenase n=1 Tax=Sphingomonas sp. SRS2 TaxID=133190 RepID=UPI0006184363|nr:3-isopropylmalate dehydrogenase [Sphingomonas sp. SRS2]KKC24032.1 3-isopropylmalate dehydrogenase [Sphingomonas sp. SRS2]
MTKTILLLAGDGIGPEVTAQSRRVIEHLNHDHGSDVAIDNALFGGAAIDAAGVPIEDATVARALASDAVLLGAVGGPQWAEAAYNVRPEAGLLRLRTAMNVFANLRPALCFEALADESTLKREYIDGLDIMFVRELVGGVYFNTPRGIEDMGSGKRRGINTQNYTSDEIIRVARVGFELARKRSGRLCSVEKSNVMESGLLWREEVTALGASDYSDVELSHMYADNCAMQLVRAPKQFDVILTDNLFGDLLSDAAAMLTGSLGMLPSAALGDAGAPGLYEPIHGSAPDIAGKDIANPCASILSLAMALRSSLGRPDLAETVEHAVARTLADGYRTADLAGGSHLVGTSAMGDAILARL